jgi:hypothetical protein
MVILMLTQCLITAVFIQDMVATETLIMEELMGAITAMVDTVIQVMAEDFMVVIKDMRHI